MTYSILIRDFSTREISLHESTAETEEEAWEAIEQDIMHTDMQRIHLIEAESENMKGNETSKVEIVTGNMTVQMDIPKRMDTLTAKGVAQQLSKVATMLTSTKPIRETRGSGEVHKRTRRRRHKSKQKRWTRKQEEKFMKDYKRYDASIVAKEYGFGSKKQVFQKASNIQRKWRTKGE